MVFLSKLCNKQCNNTGIIYNPSFIYEDLYKNDFVKKSSGFDPDMLSYQRFYTYRPICYDFLDIYYY